jgi:hypothetical protein
MKTSVAALALLLPCLAAAPDSGKGKALGNPAAPLLIEMSSDFQCPPLQALSSNRPRSGSSPPQSWVRGHQPKPN